MSEGEAGPMRSDRDVTMALNQVEQSMVQQVLTVPPDLFVHLPVVRQALYELLERRRQERDAALQGDETPSVADDALSTMVDEDIAFARPGTALFSVVKRVESLERNVKELQSRCE